MHMRKQILVMAAMALLTCMATPAVAYMPDHTAGVITGDEMAVSLFGAGGGGQQPDDNCTDSTAPDPDDNEAGILTQIEQYLKEIVDGSTARLYNAIIFDSGFQSAVTASITLMVIVFGVLFMVGMVQLTLGQVIVRLFKIGIVVSITGFWGWLYFQKNVMCFFVGGADGIIRFVLANTTGLGGMGLSYDGPCGMQQPVFGQLDTIARDVLRPETMAKILAALTTGPYGLAMGGLMVIATIGFLKLLIEALKVYAISYVARALLFALAPIFIVFLLFERTKNYFTSWLNGIINFTLQPVLLFIMLAFMMDLIDQAARNMLGVEVCWAEFQSTEGSPSKMQFWRFANNGQVDPSEYDWQGQVSCRAQGADTTGSNCDSFPIDIVDILGFVFLIFLASRFASVIERITSQLSNIFISLDQGMRMEQFLQKQNERALGGLQNAAGSLTGTRPPS